MKAFETTLRMLVLSVLLSASSAMAQAPRIFFTDLTSGPNSGGESVSGFSGAYVTIYGNFFGTSQGSSTVTLNGSSCLRVVSWGTSWLWYQKLVVQLGSSCTSGRLSVTVNGRASTSATATVHGSVVDPSLFTVRSGHIYCVSTGGSDSNPGTFAGGCWRTMPKGVHAMAPGDITYVQNGVTQSAQDPFAPYNAAISITSAGTAGNPISLVAYPGASVSVNTTQEYGIRTPAVSGPGPYWNIAGISITTSATEALSLHQPNTREIANILSCPNGTGTSACAELESDGTSNGHFVYGNQWTQAGYSGSDKTYHALYFSLGDNHIDVGWNDIHNVQGCRGIQWYNEGVDMTDLHVHDNLIHDTRCDAININGANPDAGPIEVFNNVLYNVGKGPDPHDGAALYSCVNLESNGSYSSPVQIYNNTCYNAGNSSTANPSQSGAFSLYVPSVLRNNVVYQNNGQPYLTSDAGCSQVKTGSSNDAFFGNGAAPGCTLLTLTLNLDPKFVSTSTPDFHLQAGSPMIDAGVAISNLAADRDGVTRPQGTAYDRGAYEFGSSSSSRPNPPTGLTVVVH
jgi:hypothetical protein